MEPTYRCVNGHEFDETKTREPRHREYTEDELLEDLQQLAERLDRVPRKADMDDYGQHSGRTYQLRFGSWANAVEAAGFEARDPIEDIQDRPEECPLCGKPETGLDYHHWRYGDNKIGCYICRDCHDAIHKGPADRDNPDWLVHCVEKAVKRHLEYGGDEDVASIKDRYNLPEIDVLVERALEDHSTQTD